MATVFKCDRCGEVFSDEPTLMNGSLIIRKRKFNWWPGNRIVEKSWELCPTCGKKVLDLLGGDTND